MTLNQLIEQALESRNIPYIFGASVLEEANKMKEPTKANLRGRADLRNVPFVTIDGDDSKDFDDAVFAQPWRKNGYHLMVAIADVANYVRPHTALDKEAQLRGSSAYFPTRCVPMLPENLSNNLCSLKPQVDRLALVAHVYINAQGSIRKKHVEAAVIHSHARLTYANVQKYLDGDVNAVPKNVQASLNQLLGVYKARLMNKANRFCMEYDNTEKSFVFNARGYVADIKEAAHYESNKLIEEAMISANIAVAEILHEKAGFCVNRAHSEPTGAKLKKLEALQTLYSLPELPEKITPKVVWDYVQAVPEEKRAEFKALLLQTSEKAIYCPDESGHFGLDLEHYTHFTSPIRRYPDLLVHRMLYKVEKFVGWQEIGIVPSLDELRNICEMVNDSEKVIQNTCYDLDDQLVASYYKNKTHNLYNAKVVAITKKQNKGSKNNENPTFSANGIVVSFDGGKGRAFVSIGSIHGDKYTSNTSCTVLTGERTGREIRIGSTFKIKLLQVDVKKGSIKACIPKSQSQATGKHSQSIRKGDKFESQVVDVISQGFLLSLKGHKKQAFLPIGTFEDDFYVYCEKQKTFTGRKNGVVYTVGTNFNVEVIHVNNKRNQLKVKLVQTKA